jgi:hypothetical protein
LGISPHFRDVFRIDACSSRASLAISSYKPANNDESSTGLGASLTVGTQTSGEAAATPAPRRFFELNSLPLGIIGDAREVFRMVEARWTGPPLAISSNRSANDGESSTGLGAGLTFGAQTSGETTATTATRRVFESNRSPLDIVGEAGKGRLAGRRGSALRSTGLGSGRYAVATVLGFAALDAKASSEPRPFANARTVVAATTLAFESPRRRSLEAVTETALVEACDPTGCRVAYDLAGGVLAFSGPVLVVACDLAGCRKAWDLASEPCDQAGRRAWDLAMTASISVLWAWILAVLC